MRKMRLDLDALSVDSFDTTADGAGLPGTVHGHATRVTEGLACESNDCGTGNSECGTCTDYTECGTCPTNCGTCATACGTCYDITCRYTCDPFLCTYIEPPGGA